MATKNPYLQRRPGHKRRSRMRGTTYPWKPGPLFCWLCGAPLESSAYWFRKYPPDIIFAKEEWYSAWTRHQSHRSLRKRKFSLSMPASHLADSLGEGNAWVNLFRMIIFSKNDKFLPQGYHLSGIGYTPGARTLKNKYILSLRDSTAACIGLTKENSDALQVSPVPHPFTPSDFDDNSSLEGYPIHSRCWDLIEHHIGPVAGFKLDLLVAALHKQWDKLMPQLLTASKNYYPPLHDGPFHNYIYTHLCRHEKEHRAFDRGAVLLARSHIYTEVGFIISKLQTKVIRHETILKADYDS
ncbi:uncharacterized protein MCYG_04637 [Microsporum canis CBS 113480]|uniref:Uncharacterized protein n=1 Tax=Arthroderma otae (strain ATCC MYA-4605 / CBS 113480) TaxID=554155 RepID=C5FNW5_ARTOC|nr:uncharacterized protein MCYG_04637 [Microsporum canis CBS 113480]EEQ31818.1 predicted protein [Microsporum canis CBS 113480]